ncbi:hypothetical protein CsatA_012145 [Cannabis sativa]
MVSVRVDIVSKEMIKPSSPTPHHLRSYQLSFLDQISPPLFVPFVMFYDKEKDSTNNYNDVVEISTKLKTAMSHVLTQFYPLAGRLNEATACVDCNDMGIPFFEANVSCQLSEFLAQNPILPIELNKFIPFKPDYEEVSHLPLGIQLNIFKCGSIAIGSCISHKFVDGISYFMFLNRWTAIARGDQDQQLRFEAASLFPPMNLSQYNSKTGFVNKNSMSFTSKRFVFKASSIKDLKQRYVVDNKSVSRVEALSAFIWNRFVAVDDLSKKTNNYVMSYPMNLRNRFDPPLLDCSFGNIFRLVMFDVDVSEDNECEIFIRKLREEFSHIDGKYLKMLQQQEGMVKHLDFIKKMTNEKTLFSFSSWCRFPLYESDFGWGKPVWVGVPPFPSNNLVVLMDSKSGDGGIEAFINLDKNVIDKLESDEEFLAFVSI